MAKFDPVIQEHVRRIKNNETHDHYLSHQIQDELIELIAQKIRQQIVEEIKEAKYFSIMMDCTPDVSREEQLSIIIRILDMGNKTKNSTVAVGFFGTIQRIYCLFASSIKRWDILKKHCTFLTLKPLSETRWECKVNSIKAIRYQVPELFRALEEVAYTTSDSKTKSEAQSLASNELESYEFILSLVI
ncbi:uncharacterized protein LOC112682493 [Sipha flava]|uniref:Uncharacterized protein LOC112682493 n=1 Tax=Sipha flava TaxID=143950 RepID=A0A8B8FE81_9HEMI|nr:uncharacterized protein LOC112682493 [Sipha flava]